MDFLFDAEILARMQFAFTVSFHIIFPAFSIGLSGYLAALNFLWLYKKDPIYLELFDYWIKIFAIAFAMGVVSGVVMSYEFGTNWSVFAKKAGPIIGPLMAYEVMSAFFLEAGFLGIMLFGRKRVGEKIHTFACAMVAFGTFASATWILAVNSWMQTPAGYSINAEGQFIPRDWLEIIFNPSFPHRFIHMVLAAYLTVSFVVAGVGAWHHFRGRANGISRKMMSMGLWAALIITPIQIFAGDNQGLNTLEYQPVKIMAIEGHFDSYSDGAPLVLFGIPNQAEQRMEYAVSIPNVSSLILKHDWNAPMKGLKTVALENQPPVWIVFFTFRIMVGIGFTMLGVCLWVLWARWHKTLYTSKPLHLALSIMTPAGFIAILAGWVTTEVGRQPYTVYGLLRTSDSIGPVEAPVLAASLLAFIVVYFCVFGTGIYFILKLMNQTPKPLNDLSTAASRAAAALSQRAEYKRIDNLPKEPRK